MQDDASVVKKAWLSPSQMSMNSCWTCLLCFSWSSNQWGGPCFVLEAWASFQREIRVQRAKSSAVLGGRLLFGVEFVRKALLGAGAAAPRAGQGLTPGGDSRCGSSGALCALLTWICCWGVQMVRHSSCLCVLPPWEAGVSILRAVLSSFTVTNSIKSSWIACQSEFLRSSIT